MACPYYQEPAADQLIGCCNGDRVKIPSETHQDCLCRSNSELYANFCPIYAKFHREKLNGSKQNILKRIFLNGYKKAVYNDELEA